ncbi:MAG: hypothetical protein ACE5JN_02120 [Candidatus Methylomirabilia bacterium]
MIGPLLRCYDLAYRRLHGLTTPDAEVGRALRVQVVRHKGRPVRLADGSEIRRGDPIGIIHLHNERVAQLHDDTGRHAAALRARRAFVTSLRELVRRLQETERYAGVKAFAATTILHGATARLGFESRFLSSRTWAQLVAAYQRALLASHHPLGRRSPTLRRLREARVIWISRETLLRRYRPEPGSLRA